MRLDRPTTRRPVIGLALLAAMLMYVSGVDLGLHLQLAHSHGSITRQHDTDPHPSPNKPVKHHCAVCNMLIGVGKPVAVVPDAPIVFMMTETGTQPVLDDVYVQPLRIYHIFQRGPPASA